MPRAHHRDVALVLLGAFGELALRFVDIGEDLARHEHGLGIARRRAKRHDVLETPLGFRGLVLRVVADAEEEARDHAHAALARRRRDRSKRIRKVKDIPEAELRRVLDACGGDLDVAAGELQASRRALKLRITELGWDRAR